MSVLGVAGISKRSIRLLVRLRTLRHCTRPARPVSNPRPSDMFSATERSGNTPRSWCTTRTPISSAIAGVM